MFQLRQLSNCYTAVLQLHQQQDHQQEEKHLQEEENHEISELDKITDLDKDENHRTSEYSKELCRRMRVTEEQLAHVGLSSRRFSPSKVRFNLENVGERATASWFIRGFDLLGKRSRAKPDDNTEIGSKNDGNVVPVEMPAAMSLDRKNLLCRFLFSWAFSPSSADTYHRAMSGSGICPRFCLKLLLGHYSSLPQLEKQAEITEALRMTYMLSSFTSIGESSMPCHPQEISQWRSSVRRRLATWTNVPRAVATGLSAHCVASQVNERHKLKVSENKMELGDEKETSKRGNETNFEDDSDEMSKLNLTSDRQEDENHEIPEHDKKTDLDKEENHRTAERKEEVVLEENEETNSVSSEHNVTLESLPKVDHTLELYEDMKINVVEESEWQSCSRDATEWSVVLAQLKRLQSLYTLAGVLGAVGGGFSLKMLIERGKGAASELVSRWLLHSKLTSPETLALLQALALKDFDDETAQIPEEQPDNEDDDEIPRQRPHPPTFEEWSPYLTEVYEQVI